MRAATRCGKNGALGAFRLAGGTDASIGVSVVAILCHVLMLGGGSAEAMERARVADFCCAAVHTQLLDQPEYDVWTERLEQQEIESPFQETVGWDIVKLTADNHTLGDKLRHMSGQIEQIAADALQAPSENA